MAEIPTPPPILLNIPFNEEAGAATATDYSPSGANALIKNGAFVPGRASNAVRFAGEGYAEIREKIIPVSGIYSLCLWIKAEQMASTPTDSWLLVKFAGNEQFLYLDLHSPLTSWTYLCLIQYAGKMAINMDSILINEEAFPAGWGKPTGWCLLNDNPNSGAGYVSLEDLTVYDGIVSGEIITPPTSKMDVNYFIDGFNFLDFGVNVSDSDGVIDNLAMKEPFSVEWPDYHGEVIDLSKPRYEAREITLSCFIEGVSKDQFLDRVKYFIGVFDQPGTRQLIISAHTTKPLVYQVYLKESINLKKKWSKGLNVGTFELKLREPEPVKRILKYSGGATCTIQMNSPKMLTVYWGDGSKTANAYGALTLNHGYPGGDFYITIAGVIEEITGFSTNADIVWGKL